MKGGCIQGSVWCYADCHRQAAGLKCTVVALSICTDLLCSSVAMPCCVYMSCLMPGVQSHGYSTAGHLRSSYCIRMLGINSNVQTDMLMSYTVFGRAVSHTVFYHV